MAISYGRAGLAGVVVVAALGVCGCDDSGAAASRTSSAAPSASAPSPSKTAAPRKVVPRVPEGVTAGYVVFDREAGRVTVEHDARRRFRSASVVKILIALDHLQRSGGDRARLRSMLRSSDDRAATALWARGGKRAIIERMVRTVGLKETGPPPAGKPGFWGYTAISAADVVRAYRHLFERADRRHRDLILGELRHATKCGKDRFDQSFGIPSAAPRPWAVKQGWSGYGDAPARPCSPAPAPAGVFRPAAAPDLGLGRPVLHTTGTVGAADRKIVVVLTLQPAGASFEASAARLTRLTKDVHRAG